MRQFSAGDTVMCGATGYSSHLKLGERYTVQHIGWHTGVLRVALQEIPGWFSADYFYKQDTQMQTTGRKDDSGKRDVTLLFDDLPNALYAVTEVLQWAITKKQPTPYERGSWQGVEDFQRRYRAAMLRHTLDAAISAQSPQGNHPIEDQVDGETGLRQLAHIATDALFQLEMAIRNSRSPQ